nr:XcbB/CpsF family capsular polysaccharide biosynthesis protein [Neisseria meningitidis]
MDKILKFKFSSNTKYEDLYITAECTEIYIDKSDIGDTHDEKLKHNFIAVARKNIVAKKFIADLANQGFFLIHHTNGISIYKRLINHLAFIKNFTQENILVREETFYTLEEPTFISESPKLLVVFSSIADFPFNASISRRMFFTNYSSVSKYIPKDTYILRIADMGGVLGSFYLNSNFDPKFESKVQNLIHYIQVEKNISPKNTVLYGTSKGATGALYHGIQLGLKTLAVDPIVSDDFYLKELNDLHFVQDVFPSSKNKKFFELMTDYSSENLEHIHIVTSRNSEQYQYIVKILQQQSSIKQFVFNNPHIKGHTDIGDKTLNFASSMLNILLYNLSVEQNLETTY